MEIQADKEGRQAIVILGEFAAKYAGIQLTQGGYNSIGVCNRITQHVEGVNKMVADIEPKQPNKDDQASPGSALTDEQKDNNVETDGPAPE